MSDEWDHPAPNPRRKLAEHIQLLLIFSRHAFVLTGRVPHDHLLRPLRAMTDEALQQLKSRFRNLYAKVGRPSIAPEKLLRALLLQALYSVGSFRSPILFA
jgi:hypothetical protein